MGEMKDTLGVRHTYIYVTREYKLLNTLFSFKDYNAKKKAYFLRLLPNTCYAVQEGQKTPNMGMYWVR